MRKKKEDNTGQHSICEVGKAGKAPCAWWGTCDILLYYKAHNKKS